MKSSFYFFLILTFSFAFIGISCSSNTTDFTFQLPERNTDWQSISHALTYRELPVISDEKTIELFVYKFSSSDFKAELHHGQPKRMTQWSEELQPTLLINGGFFNEQNEPTGWLVINGEVIGTNKYSPDVSGLLLIHDGLVTITDSLDATSTQINSSTSLLQSFPVLIKQGGNPGITENSEKIARRTVVAKNTAGEILVILVDQTPVSLYELMQGLLNSDLTIDIALNLDGGPSTGLIAQLEGHSKSIIPLTPLPQVVSFSIHPQEK